VYLSVCCYLCVVSAFVWRIKIYIVCVCVCVCVTVDCEVDANCRSALQEHAVQLGLDMLALTAVQCTSLLRSDLLVCAQELDALLPCVKVCSDWMICHETLWNPPPLPSDPELGYLAASLNFCHTHF